MNAHRRHRPREHSHSGDGLLARLVSRAAGASARRPRTVMALWLVFVAACVGAGAATGTQMLTDSESGTGESARADQRVEDAGLRPPAAESVMVRSADPATTRAAAGELVERLEQLPEVGSVEDPRGAPALSAEGGRSQLVRLTLRGDPDDAPDRVGAVEATVAAVAAQHPRVELRQSGLGSIYKAVDDLVAEDLERAHTVALPITLLILVVAFGALVAATVPLLLGVTSVAAAMGALGLISQLAPTDESASSLIVVIGLAVGVDYSLFYIRREREERRAGRGPDAALAATAATVGRALVVSGVTVIVALAGLLLTGLAAFTSMGLATITVVAIAMTGSVTVLPAVLARLGDRVDRGRVPLLARRQRRRGGPGVWARVARSVTRHPVAALVAAVSVLGALAVPALDLRTATSDESALPPDSEVVADYRAIERVFPGAPSHAELVAVGRGLDATAARERLRAFGRGALEASGGRGAVGVDVSRDGRTAVVSVPMADRDVAAAQEAVGDLRAYAASNASEVAPGTEVLVTGETARGADFSAQLSDSTPLVIAFVLGFALLLLIGAFRSTALAASVIALNLLSVAATYGVLTAVFQHDWAEGLLGFTSSGTIATWVPLFIFVILFGLSMDYSILVLERIREARRSGRGAREAAAEGVGATAGAVTSAAVVMVAVFSIFAAMRFLDMKQLGVGLSVAILLDATIVRGVALPAAVALLGERRWRVRESRSAARRWDDHAQATALAPGIDAR